jgi:hypothetical protein
MCEFVLGRCARKFVKEDTFHRAIVEKVTVMLLARDAQGADIELLQSLEMRGRRFDGR